MVFFWYLMLMLCGALGALSVLRALEMLAFGGDGSIPMQAGLGVGFLMLAAKSLGKARTLRRPVSPRAEAPPLE